MKLVLVRAVSGANTTHFCSILYSEEGVRQQGSLLVYQLSAFVRSIIIALKHNDIRSIEFGQGGDTILDYYLLEQISPDHAHKIALSLKAEGVDSSLVGSL